MPEQLFFVSTHRVAEGAQEEVRRLGAEFVRAVVADEPHTLGVHVYLDGAGDRLTYVHLQRDAEGMDRHMVRSAERIARVLALAPTESITVCGTPGPVLREALRRNTSAGAIVTVTPELVDGFEWVASG